MSKELGFSPARITQSSAWWQAPWEVLWHEAAQRVKDLALEEWEPRAADQRWRGRAARWCYGKPLHLQSYSNAVCLTEQNRGP